MSRLNKFKTANKLKSYNKNIKKQYANILTLLNLCMGLISILLSSAASGLNLNSADDIDFKTYFIAAILIVIAALTDRFDGKVARHYNIVTDLGKQLDSLCDLVSFGIAPSLLIWKINIFAVQYDIAIMIFGYCISLSFALAGAIRLAKFNVQEESGVFYGIPITVAGFFAAILSIISLILINLNHFNKISSSINLIIVALLAILMVSKIKFQKR